MFFYVRFGVSYRDLEEIMAERGVSVGHTTLNRRVTQYSGAIADAAHRRKGSWVYFYRAVDKNDANTAGIKAINNIAQRLWLSDLDRDGEAEIPQ